jgi:hypothetical protein
MCSFRSHQIYSLVPIRVKRVGMVKEQQLLNQIHLTRSTHIFRLLRHHGVL